jgi:hypothetical protein
MNKTNETTPRPQVRNDVIELGVASVETKGPLLRQEDVGGTIPMGISNE